MEGSSYPDSVVFLINYSLYSYGATGHSRKIYDANILHTETQLKYWISI